MPKLLNNIRNLFQVAANRARPVLEKVFLKISPAVAKLSALLRSWFDRLKYKYSNSSPRKRVILISIPAALILIYVLTRSIFGFIAPPDVVGIYPSDKSTDVEQTVAIEIDFSKDVNRPEVEKYFSLSPKTAGKFTWQNNRSVVFTPAEPLKRGTVYTINFSGPITSAYSIPNTKKISSAFTVIGNPRIVFKAPEIEAPESKTPITLIFSQPMHALTTATASSTLEDILTVSPDLTGSGKWLGTTAYQFTPAANYKHATTYTVTVNPDLKSIEGFPLDKKYTWSFSGVRLKVVKTGPEIRSYFNNGTVVPTASISAYFNIPPDPKLNLSDFFVIKDNSSQPVTGRIVTQNSALHFVPAKNWTRGETYTAIVRKGLTTADGPNPMEDDYQWSFTVLPKLSVQSTYPKNNTPASDDESGISISFNAKLNKSFVNPSNFRVEPPLAHDGKTAAVTCSSSCDSVNLNGKLERLTDYRVTVSKNVTDVYGSQLDQDYVFTFKTGPHKTAVSFVPGNLEIVVVNQSTPIEVFNRTMNASQITYTLYKIEESDFLTAERASYSSVSYYPNPPQKIKSWSVPVKKIEDEYVKQSTTVTDAKGNSLSPGYYYLEAAVEDGKTTAITFLATKSTLTVKKGTDKILVWATDQTNGQTVSGMKIKLTDANGKKLEETTTNSDGVAYLKTPDYNSLPQTDRNLFIFGSTNNDVTVTGTRWSYGISEWDFGLPYYTSHESIEYPAYIVLDRPLYRPGQEVMYKGIVRKDTDGAFETIKAGDTVSVTVKDAHNREILTENKTLTGFGTFSGKFTLSSDGSLGYYSISVKYKDSRRNYTRTFQVEEYKRQDFKVAITPEKNDFVSGDNLKFNINSSYYFGSPLKNAPVFYTVKMEDFYFHWDRNPQYEFGQPDSYWYRPWSDTSSGNDKSLAEVNTFTDSSGNLDVSMPVNMGQEKQSKRIVVDAAVTDLNNQTVGASEEIFLHKAGVYVGIKPRDYVNKAGTDTLIDTVTLDPLGNPLPGRKVSLEFFRISWVSAREESPDDGSFYYRNKAVETSVATAETTTDDKGLGSAGFVPDIGGTYKVVATSTDDRGNVMTSNTYFWVSGSQFESTRENHDRIPLVTDKYQYEKGDKAKLFISTPYGSDHVKTLITFERNNILSYKVIDVDEKNITFDFPVEDFMVPNVFISAVLVRGGPDLTKPPEFKIGYTELRVLDKTKQLNVNINTDKTRYGPRDTVKTNIDVTDAAGNPREAELSLALVDRSLLDMASTDYPNPYSFFYEPRDLGVNTSQSLTFSLNRLNASVNSDSKGGDGSEDSRLSTKRKYFPETDYWNAHLVTDKNGHASVDIPLADNLTTWKFTAVANTDKDAFGIGTKEILATKDVLLRSVSPRFLATGDQSDIGAILVNNGETDLSVDVTLAAQGLTTKDRLTKRVQIVKGQQSNVLWHVTAGDVDNALVDVTAKTEDGKTLDDLEIGFPVVKYQVPETTATAGSVDTQKTETVTLPSDVIKIQGSLDVKLSSSLLGSTIGALSYLIGYPYGCVEQTTSRFYAAIPLYTLMQKNGVKTIGIYTQENLLDIITQGVQKLQNEQRKDGGWGWWVSSNYSDPYLSAYAYQALSEVKDAGLAVSDTTVTNAENYLLSQLGKSNNTQPDTESYIVRSLSRTKNSNLTGYIENLFNKRAQLSTEGKAYLLTSMYYQNYDKTRQARLKDELMSKLRKTATGVHWEDVNHAYYSMMGSASGTTASILEMLLTTDPGNPLIDDIARYFQASLKQDYWYTTKTTSSILHSLVLYTANKSDFGAEYKYTATVNGISWKNGNLSKNDMGGMISLTKPISQLSIGKDNSVVFSKNGNGNLYYTMNLNYFLPYAEIAPLDQGITIIREYEDTNGNPITTNRIKAGSIIRVKLTVVVNDTRNKLIIEDKLPAGLEANNENLQNSVANPEPEGKPSLGTYPLYYDNKEYRDDRVVYFTNYLTPGVYQTSYYAHATTVGKYHRPPAQASEMYMPDVMGHSDGGWFEVVN